MENTTSKEVDNQYKIAFKDGIIEAFDLYIKEKMEEKEFLLCTDIQKKLTIQMAIVTVWKHYYNTDFSQYIEETNLREIDLKEIINEVREEMIKKYK